MSSGGLFSFRPDLGETPETVARRRRIAEALLAGSAGRAPQTIGEGLAALGAGIGARLAEGRATRAEAAGRAGADSLFGSIFGGGGGAAPAATTEPISLTGDDVSALFHDIGVTGSDVDLSGIAPDMGSAAGQLFSAMPPELREGIRIRSAYRPYDKQYDIYHRQKIRPAAEPGRSLHEYGSALDIDFMSPEAKQWLYANAGNYGLEFPLPDTDAGHLQLASAKNLTRNEAASRAYQASLRNRSGSNALRGGAGADVLASGGGLPDIAAVEQYIRQAAQQRGIDPEIAVRVAKSEGLAPDTWQSNVVNDGVRETSYGPFQLRVGGGLGDEFVNAGLGDPSDPSTWQAQVNFALDQARQGGWSPWYGAAKAGIGDREGIGESATLPGTEAVSSTGVIDVANALGFDPAAKDDLYTPAATAPGAGLSAPPYRPGGAPPAGALPDPNLRPEAVTPPNPVPRPGYAEVAQALGVDPLPQTSGLVGPVAGAGHETLSPHLGRQAVAQALAGGAPAAAGGVPAAAAPVAPAAAPAAPVAAAGLSAGTPLTTPPGGETAEAVPGEAVALTGGEVPTPTGETAELPGTEPVGGAPTKEQLLQVMMHPWASDEQKAIAGMLYKQMLENEAPPSPADLETMRHNRATEGLTADDNARERAEYELAKRRLQFDIEQGDRTTETKNYDQYAADEIAAGRVPVGRLDYEKIKAGAARAVSSPEEVEEIELRKANVAVWKDRAADYGEALAFKSTMAQLAELGQDIDPGTRTGILNWVRETTGVSLDDSAGPLQAYDAMINYLKPRMRVPGTGASSDRDVKAFAASLPSLFGTAEGNQIITLTLNGMADQRLRIAEIASDYIAGDITKAEATEQLHALGDADPFEEYKAYKAANAAAPVTSGGKTYPKPPYPAIKELRAAVAGGDEAAIEEYERVFGPGSSDSALTDLGRK